MAGEIDKDLLASLKAAKGGRVMQFALFPKGTEGTLLVSKTIPPKVLAETKKKVGATTIFKGRVLGEKGILVFEVAKEPPGTLFGYLKRRLKDDAGLTGTIEIRVKGDAEEGLAETEAGAKAEPPKEVKPISLVALQQCRLVWASALKKVQADLETLQKEAREAYKNDPLLGAIEAAIAKNVALLQGHAESLSDRLDAALNAEDPLDRQELHREAGQEIRAFLTYMDTNAVVKEIDDNGLVPLQIRRTLSTVLPVLATKLGA